METKYIVSGYMRSGTSMMMKALEAGGLTAAHSPIRDKMNDNYGDNHYKPNPNGFYEVTMDDLRHRDMPYNIPGNLVKLLYSHVTRICPGKYRIIFMLRDPEEIRQSFEAFFGKPPPRIDQYQQIMDYTISMLRVRSDCRIHVMQYRDVVDNPARTFKLLRYDGWPIDPKKAAKVVDPKLFRFRKELLTPGA